MKRLRFLKLSRVELTGGYIYRQGSNLRYVWEDSGVLAKLKILDLSYSYSLKQSPDFSTIPNLKELVLESYWQLAEVHQSIGGLKRLSLVNFRGCKILEELPRSFYNLKSIVTLVLDGCKRFEKLDQEIGDMTSLSTLRADRTAITELPSSIGSLSSLKSLHIGCSNLQSLPSLSGLSQLVYLRLLDCNLTDELIKVMDLESLSSLKSLDLGHNSFSSLPSLRSLSKLVDLGLGSCENLVAIPDLPTSLTNLWAFYCTALEIMPDFSDMSYMREMFLNRCAKLVEISGLDESLKSSMRLLVMEGCINITATLKEKILQGWNFIGCADIMYLGPGGIFLPPSDIPEWFPWVNEGGRINFRVPEIRGSNVIAITLCFTYLKNDIGEPQSPSSGILITNHTKLTTFYSWPVELGSGSGLHYFEYLWLGHLPSYKFNLEGGDLVEVLIRTSCPFHGVKKSGVSLVWDTKQPEFRVETDWVDRMFFSCPYTGGNNNME